MKRFFYLICFLIVALACKEVFEPPPQALLKASFYNSVTSSSKTNVAMSPSITMLGVGLDSLWTQDVSAFSVLMPLTVKDTSRYIIWLDSKSDSITFIHKTTQKYATMESGFYYEYKLRSVRYTHNRIDSIKIVDSLVTTKWNENIKLYIHPLPAGTK